MGETADTPITITEAALDAAVALFAEHPEWRGLPLRLYIEGKGCDGFYYGVSFDEARPEDREVFHDEARKLRLIVDPDSLPFVAGAQITWVDNELGKGFLVNNPQQRAFRGKFYHRKAWVERLGADPK